MRPLLVALALLALAACAEPSDAPESDPAASDPTAADTVSANQADTMIPEVALTADQAANDALRTGELAPSFTLPDADGDASSLGQALAQGPVVLVFYRGAWCPYCNTQLRDYADRYDEIRAAGASLIAVSPQAAEGTGAMRDSLGGADIPFPVLSDVGNEVARRYGLVFEVDEATQQRYQAVGLDLTRINTTDRWELPVPATYVIDRSAEIRAAFVEADYTQRVSLNEVLDALRTLGG